MSACRSDGDGLTMKYNVLDGRMGTKPMEMVTKWRCRDNCRTVSNPDQAGPPNSPLGYACRPIFSQSQCQRVIDIRHDDLDKPLQHRGTVKFSGLDNAPKARFSCTDERPVDNEILRFTARRGGTHVFVVTQHDFPVPILAQTTQCNVEGLESWEPVFLSRTRCPP